MNMICLLLSTTKGKSIMDIILIMPGLTTRLDEMSQFNVLFFADIHFFFLTVVSL